MSYYILPKNINNIIVNPQYSNDICRPYISFSLLNYYCQIKEQIVHMFSNENDKSNETENSNNTYDDAIKIINPYEFIFSKVPGSNYSVSKLKPRTNLFYDLFEISNNLNIFESFKQSPINLLHITKNHNDSIECFEQLREGIEDNQILYDNIDIDTQLESIKFDVIFYETDTTNYFYSIIQIVLIILKSQNNNGVSIIKIGEVFYKPVVDVLYFLSSLYEKVYICKPSTNNVTSFDRFIVCRNFQYNERSSQTLKINYYKLFIFLKKLDNKHIKEVLDFNVPYYFKNKIDDLNIIIGQQQIESLNQIISLYKNKNKDDKIESIKKNNIQKSVSWCEKYKIPCNKFSEKINIFLPINN